MEPWLYLLDCTLSGVHGDPREHLGSDLRYHLMDILSNILCTSYVDKMNHLM